MIETVELPGQPTAVVRERVPAGPAMLSPPGDDPTTGETLVTWPFTD